MKTPLSIVIRISRVAISRTSLEAALGRPVERYEAMKDGTFYSQIDVPDSADPWRQAVLLVEKIEVPLKRLAEAGQVGLASLDVAFELEDALYAATFKVPRSVSSVLASAGLDLDVSVYRSSS